ncbi:MAG: hypothetical protein WCG01_02420 [bacterium]
MTWIKRQLFKTLLRFVNRLGGHLRVAVVKRTSICARVMRAGEGKWSESRLLKQGLKFRKHFINKQYDFSHRE